MNPQLSTNGVFETKDVTDDKVDEVVAGYQLDNPIKIDKIKQPNGKWTIRATFPDQSADN